MSITDTAAPGKDNILSIHSLMQTVIVDDEPELLSEIRSKLEGNDRFRVPAVCSSGETLEFFEGGCIDLEMPEMDGMELTVVMEESFPGAPSIVTADFSFAVVERQLKKAGTINLLTTPADVDVLKNSVDSALHDCGCRQCSVLPLKIFLELTAMERKSVRLNVLRSDGRNSSLLSREGCLQFGQKEQLHGAAQS